jgi:hypothetical protein
MRSRNLLNLAGVVVLLSGCSAGAGAGKGLSISAGNHASAVGPASAAAATNAIAAGNGILITRIRALVVRAELEGSPACPVPAMPTAPVTMPVQGGARGPLLDGHGSGGSGGMDGGSGDQDDGASDDGDDQECEVEAGPFLVDLSGDALNGGVTFMVDLAAPAGTYEELKFRLGPVSASQAGSDAGLLDMADANASVLVNGTVDGTPFTFSTAATLAQKREGKLLVDPTSGANVTLDFDASGWFKAADGSRLDPTSPATQEAILANIRASLRLVADDDRDGEEDGASGSGDSSSH